MVFNFMFQVSDSGYLFARVGPKPEPTERMKETQVGQKWQNANRHNPCNPRSSLDQNLSRRDDPLRIPSRESTDAKIQGSKLFQIYMLEFVITQQHSVKYVISCHIHLLRAAPQCGLFHAMRGRFSEASAWDLATPGSWKSTAVIQWAGLRCLLWCQQSSS